MTMTTELAPRNGEAAHEIIERPKYNPIAPVGKGLKGLLEQQRAGIAQMLPRHISPERLFKTMLVAANRNPKILECTQASVLETINRAAELGLDLSGTLGEAYPVPFNNKIKVDGRDQWVNQLQLIIGYRGMEKLAWQSGEVDSIDAEVVYTKDNFVFKKGTEVFVEWSPFLQGDRGEVVGAYACVKMKSGGKLARFLTKEDIEKIRNVSKSKDSPAWRNWWDEMARKCVLKRTLKDAPLSTEKLVKALEIDAEDFTTADVLSASTGGDRTARLNSRVVAGREPSEGQHIEPTADAAENIAAHDAYTEDGPDVSGADAQPPEETFITDTWADTRESCSMANKESLSPLAVSDLSKRIAMWSLANGVKGKEEETTHEQRVALVKALEAGKLGADGKIAQ